MVKNNIVFRNLVSVDFGENSQEFMLLIATKIFLNETRKITSKYVVSPIWPYEKSYPKIVVSPYCPHFMSPNDHPPLY